MSAPNLNSRRPDRGEERPTVGVLVGWQAYEGGLHSFLDPVFRGIRAAARDLNCNVLLACGVSYAAGSAYQTCPAWPVYSTDNHFVPVGPWNTDGLLVVTPLTSEARSLYLQQLIADKHPVVFIGGGEHGPAVVPDNAGGIRQALGHLVEHGHRRIAFIAGASDLRDDSGDRFNAYHAAIQEYDLETDPRLVAYGFHNQPEGARAMQHILESGVAFTAVLASNDESAFGAMQVLREAGRAIPRDVAIVGFDDRYNAMAQTPPLTSVHYSTFEAGYVGLTSLFEHIQGQPITALGDEMKLPARLVIRESCGCPPRAIASPLVSAPADSSGASAASVLPHGGASRSAVEGWAEQALRQVMTKALPVEVLPLDPAFIPSMGRRLLDALAAHQAPEDIQDFYLTLRALLSEAEAAKDDPYAWQATVSALTDGLASLLKVWRPPLPPVQVEEILRQAQAAISESLERQHVQYVNQQITLTDQLGLMTARLLEVLDEAQILATLAESLPQMGIRHAQVVFFEPEGKDPVAWCRLPTGPEDQAHRFPSREFPPPGLYEAQAPFQLALLPLVIQEQASGFVAFDAAHLDMCATIVRQVAAAFKSARLYRQVAEERRVAEEANRLKSRFLSTVSHELRTPLNLIVGLSEILLRDQAEPAPHSVRAGADGLPDPYRQDMEQIHNSAKHLDSLIRDVLDLARSEAGELRLMREPLDLGEVLRAVAVTGEQLARDKELSWHAEIPDNLPRVWGDRTRLRQVVLNLISNAVKFTEQGTITLEVKRMKQEEGSRKEQAGRLNAPREFLPSSFLLLPSTEYLLIRVSDTGLGIPPAEQEIIFDEFRQSEQTTTRGYGGLGLGLAISKRLVELHGGEIGVFSSGEEGAGSTFYFSLPVMEQPVAPEPPTEAESVKTEFPDSRTVMILLAGPSSNTSQRLREHLTQQGFDVEEYPGNETTWIARLMAPPPIRMVILDLLLASERGWEILKMLKGNPATQNVPVLFYSLAQTADAGSILELDYLSKPVAMSELALALARQGLTLGSEGEKTILIVDDEPGILEMHARMVQSHSPTYQVLKAHDGLEALKLMRQTPPDLVLLDLMMPGADGFTVLEAMREEVATRDIPVIVLTAQVLTERDMALLNRGVATVLGKGLFSGEETLAHVQAALMGSRKLGSEAQRLVRRAMAYLHTHYSELVTREGLAQHVGVSENYLTRCFRYELGLTPMVYLNRYRINRAKTLLTTSSKSITEIAMAVGFEDSNYFGRIFRREVGVTPRAYRQGYSRPNRSPSSD